mgnify:FL=1
MLLGNMVTHSTRYVTLDMLQGNMRDAICNDLTVNGRVGSQMIMVIELIKGANKWRTETCTFIQSTK